MAFNVESGNTVYFIYDDFLSSGPIGNHTPQIGGAWAVSPDYSANAIITNNGTVSITPEDAAINTGTSFQSNTSLPSTDFIIEYDLVFRGPERLSTFQISRTGYVLDFEDILMDLIWDADVGELYTGLTGQGTIVFPIALPAGVPFTVKHVITSSHKIYINGTLLVDEFIGENWFASPSNPEFPLGKIGFFMRTSYVNTNLELSKLRVYTYDDGTGGGGGGGGETVADESLLNAALGTITLPVNNITKSQYADIRLRNKTAQWPQVYYDDGNYPDRKLYFWPIPQQSNMAEIWVWEPLATYETLDNEINLPPGYERYLRYSLALELASIFGKTLTPEVIFAQQEAEDNVKMINQRTPISKP